MAAQLDEKKTFFSNCSMLLFGLVTKTETETETENYIWTNKFH